MFGALKEKFGKKEDDEAVENIYSHRILFSKTDTSTLHLLKCSAIENNPIRVETIEDRHFFFCPICGQKLDDADFVDVVEEKKRREEEMNAVYTFG